MTVKHFFIVICLTPLLLCAKEPSLPLAAKLNDLPRAEKAPEENDAQYLQRMAVISEAVRIESGHFRWGWGRVALRAATLAVWYRETRFAKDVHAGKPGYYGSDGGRAKCLGQIHASGLVPLEEWETLGGTDVEATSRCARATMRLLVFKAERCGLTKEALSRESVARLFDAYGTGSCKKRMPAKERKARAELWRKMYDWGEIER